MKHSDSDTAPEKLRCDVCGKFVSPFGDDGATRNLITPDAEGTAEVWETLCKKHSNYEAHEPRTN